MGALGAAAVGGGAHPQKTFSVTHTSYLPKPRCWKGAEGEGGGHHPPGMDMGTGKAVATASEPLLPAAMGYKSTTDHEEEEEDSEDMRGHSDREYFPPTAKGVKSSRSMTRLPPRAANPTLDFGTGRRPGTQQQDKHKARQSFNRHQRHKQSNGATSSPQHRPAAPPGQPAEWPLAKQASASFMDVDGALRCTSYCCAHALELVGVDRWLHAHGQHGQWYKDGLNAVLHCFMSSDGMDELCKSTPGPPGFSPPRPRKVSIPRSQSAGANPADSAAASSTAAAAIAAAAAAAAPCLAAPFAAPAAARRRGPSARSESLAAAG
jgi:hypothetical protein